MTSPASSEPTRPPARRTRRLPATGMPVQRDSRRISSIVSLLIHVAIVLLLVTDVASHEGFVQERPQGAGGPGPAGGGGGGRRGTGGSEERVRYVQVAPPPAPAPAAAVVPPPVIPQPAVIPPPVQTKPEPTPDLKSDLKVDVKVAEPTAPTPGKGGGTGSDGTSGTGPGSGGGVGAGIGTGRGSGVGPGTGGGVQANYPPTPTELFIPPLPMPDKVRGFHLVAEYDVDETGKVLDFTFTPTRDGGYNRKLADVLKSFKFRPGTTPDGKPIRMKAQIIYDF